MRGSHKERSQTRIWTQDLFAYTNYNQKILLLKFRFVYPVKLIIIYFCWSGALRCLPCPPTMWSMFYHNDPHWTGGGVLEGGPCLNKKHSSGGRSRRFPLKELRWLRSHDRAEDRRTWDMSDQAVWRTQEILQMHQCLFWNNSGTNSHIPRDVSGNSRM